MAQLGVATAARSHLLMRHGEPLRHLTPGISLDARLLATLHRLLAQAVLAGSDRGVVKVFIDALAVWLDVEIRAYVADVDHRYELAVMLPGAGPAALPAGFAHFVESSDRVWRRPTVIEPGADGTADDAEAVLVPVRGRHAAPWVLAMSRRTPIDVEAEVSAYVDALAQALDEVAALDTSRLTWSVIQLFVQDAPSPARLHDALAQVSANLGAALGLSITTAGGTPVLTVGETAHLPLTGFTVATERLLVVRVDAPLGYAATLGARAPAGRAFTLNDVRKLEAIAGVCGAALGPILRLRAGGPERRARRHSFDEAVERHARDAAARDEPVSVIVIALPRVLRTGSDLRAWLTRFREALRPTDLAGILSPSEVGVLLLDTPSDGAGAVQQRLTRLLRSGTADEAVDGASMGLATHEPGGSADSLLDRARARAQQPVAE